MIPQIQDVFIEHQTSILIFILSIVVFYTVRFVLLHRLSKLSKLTNSSLDDIAVDVIASIGMPFAIIAGLVGAVFVTTDVSSESMTGAISILTVAFIIVTTWQITKIVGVLFQYGARKFTKNSGGINSVQGLKTVIDLLIWASGGLFVLSTLGFNISSLIAGLGIGGIAIALALQTILSDIFSSFSIYFDQPFVVGDYVVTSNGEGTVEKIGLKTTRLRSLRGEEVIMSNKDLTSGTIQNFGKLKRRRILTTLNVTYNTSNKKLQEIRDKMPFIFEDIENLTFDRLHFKKLNESSLDFELVYYVESSDYSEYVNIEHSVNMAIKAWFEKNKIEMAYPTQTVYLQK